MEKQEIIEGISENIQSSKNFVEEIRKYLLEPRGEVSINTSRSEELMEGMLVKDITSFEQFNLGITILLVTCSKLIEFGEHYHDNQSQLIFIMEGTVYDSQAKITYIAGQSFFVPKSNRHTIRYYPGTQAIIYYMPKLKSI